MARTKILKITAFVLTFILCVVSLIPAQFNLHMLVFNPGSEFEVTAEPTSAITDEPDASLGPDITDVPVEDETPVAAPSATPSYYEKYTTPYSSAATSPSYSKESHHYSVSLTYPSTYRIENTLYFKVVINAQLVYVYRRNSAGQPTTLVRTMIVSTGMDRSSNATPLGRYMIINNEDNGAGKARWIDFGTSYGQYSTRLFYITNESSTGMKGYFTGYLFHSELYRAMDPTRLMVDEYNTLGYPRSHGCIRMQVKDARWIYLSAPTGSIVEIVDGTSDTETWAKLKPALLVAGTDYDPSDPAKPGVTAENPLPLFVQVSTAAPKATATPAPTATPVVTPEPTEAPVVTAEPTPEVTPEESPEKSTDNVPEFSWK